MNNQPVSSTSSGARRGLRWVILAGLALGVALLLSGCGGFQALPLEREPLSDLGQQMAAIERMGEDELNEQLETFENVESEEAADRARAYFLAGYIRELKQAAVQDPDDRRFRRAADNYQLAVKEGSPYATQAAYRLGILAANRLIGTRDESTRTAKQYLRSLGQGFNVQVWARGMPSDREPELDTSFELAGEGGAAVLVAPGETPPPANTPVLRTVEVADDAMKRLDGIYQTGGGFDQVYYRVVDTLVGFFRAITPTYAVVLMLFALALFVKVITAPLTTISYRGMRDMQRIQPLLKDLQEKYREDKAKLAEEQMKLMKAHNVNPMGGCLPLLIQFPIFIVVYQAVMVYSFEFSKVGFLWVGNLARPDWPLLILYAVSMIITQKLTTTPTADPQQKAMQTQMTYMMPILLLLFLSKMASAFVLYWLFLNILSSAHQYYLIQRFKKEEAAAGLSSPAPEPTTPRKQKKGRS